ncbi:MAG: hypothetical protein WBH73_03515 [Arcanobacterium sp.]
MRQTADNQQIEFLASLESKDQAREDKDSNNYEFTTIDFIEAENVAKSQIEAADMAALGISLSITSLPLLTAGLFAFMWDLCLVKDLTLNRQEPKEID